MDGLGYRDKGPDSVPQLVDLTNSTRENCRTYFGKSRVFPADETY